MKVIVTSTGNSLESNVDPRFGRCQLFMVVDTETMSYKAVPNSSINTPHGAGIAAAQNVTRLNAKVVITGHVGPNAHMALSAAGIEIYTGAIGTVENAIKMFKKGELMKASSPTVSGHFGQGRGRGRRRF
jgi:predicted Fe-Mo cluster-binding NifX family protein